MSEIGIQTVDGSAVGLFVDEMAPVYAQVYAEPPYLEGPEDVADFLSWLSDREDMRLVLARDGSRLVGFGLAFRLRDGSWWTRLLDPLPADFDSSESEAGRTLVILELAVDAGYRRRGIARSIHDALLDQPGLDRASLTVRPESEAEPARRAYAKWGWRQVSRKQPWAEAPVYNLMLLPLGS